jgi:CRP-like cAMP-binding protein
MGSKLRPSGHVSRGKTIQYRENRILSALPPEEFRRIAPHLTETPLTFKQSLSKAGQPIARVCFPDSGVCSVMAVMRSGAAAEVGTVGNEGVTGLALFFGNASEPSESLIQVPGRGRLLPAHVFQAELARRGVLYDLVANYAHALVVQIMQSAACNALHSVDRRACKWMLMTHDRVFTDEFKLTHEFLGMMLGASRPHVTTVARRLQRAGLISYHHGQVTVLDRRGLEAGSCECYGIVSSYFNEFLARLSLVSRSGVGAARGRSAASL